MRPWEETMVLLPCCFHGLDAFISQFTKLIQPPCYARRILKIPGSAARGIITRMKWVQ